MAVAIIFDDPREVGLLFPDSVSAEQYDLRGRAARFVGVVTYDQTNTDIADQVVQEFSGASFLMQVKEMRARTAAGLHEAKELIRAAQARAQQ